MYARGLAVLVAVLTGCTAQVEVDEGCEYMSRQVIDGEKNRIEHWGVGTVLKAPWRQNDVRPVIFKPPYKDPRTGLYCVPQAQSILLTSLFTGDQTGGNYAFRWQLKVGGGGGSAVVKFDMLNTQQIAIAGENINIEAVCENILVGPQPFDIGANNIVAQVSASMADGNVSSGQATYTQRFIVANGAALTLPIPSMATSFHISGNDGLADAPLQANVIYGLTTGSSGVLYDGAKLSQYNSDFYEIPGTARSMLVTNGAATPIAGYIQWGLDL